MRWQRPSLNAKFHIDLNWWKEQNRDLRVYIREMLCPECREAYANSGAAMGEIDWVDDQTGEVMRVDGLWHSLRTCCSKRPGFIGSDTPVVEAVFRTFLANGNKALSVRELHELLDRRSPEMLLRMLTAGQVYLGIRPTQG